MPGERVGLALVCRLDLRRVSLVRVLWAPVEIDVLVAIASLVPVIASLASAARKWRAAREATSVEVVVGDQKVELSAFDPEQAEQIVKKFIALHPPLRASDTAENDG